MDHSADDDGRRVTVSLGDSARPRGEQVEHARQGARIVLLTGTHEAVSPTKQQGDRGEAHLVNMSGTDRVIHGILSDEESSLCL